MKKLIETIEPSWVSIERMGDEYALKIKGVALTAELKQCISGNKLRLVQEGNDCLVIST